MSTVILSSLLCVTFLSVCSAHSDYVKHDGACIRGHKIGSTLSGVTLEECQADCDALAQCKSLDYKPRNNNCHLHDVDSAGAGDKFHDPCSHSTGNIDLFDKVEHTHNPCDEDPSPCVDEATCEWDGQTVTCNCPEGSHGDGLANGDGCHVDETPNFWDAYCHKHGWEMTEYEGCTADPPIEGSYCHGFCWSASWVDWFFNYWYPSESSAHHLMGHDEGSAHIHIWDYYKYCYCCEPWHVFWKKSTLTCSMPCDCTDPECKPCEPYWLEIPGACINETNIAYHANTGVGDCQDLCVEWGLDCRSVEVREDVNDMCHLQDQNCDSADFRSPCHLDGYNLYVRIDPWESGYLKVPGACINESNSEITFQTSLEECKEMCDNDPTCMAYEHKEIRQRCQLSTEGLGTPHLRSPCHVTGYDLYFKLIPDPRPGTKPYYRELFYRYIDQCYCRDCCPEYPWLGN